MADNILRYSTLFIICTGYYQSLSLADNIRIFIMADIILLYFKNFLTTTVSKLISSGWLSINTITSAT
jgi:hypothetical protein